MNSQLKRPKLNRDYEALKFQASVLYIKHGLSAEAIFKQLDVSMVTLAKWNKAGRWKELRPDMEVLKEYKAANMYIEKGLSPAEISQKLSVSEVIIKLWIDLNGWNAAKRIARAQDITGEIVSDFCTYFKSIFPENSSLIEVAQNSYKKKINPLK